MLGLVISELRQLMLASTDAAAFESWSLAHSFQPLLSNACLRSVSCFLFLIPLDLAAPHCAD